MTTLFHSAHPVKSATFGRGIFNTTPVYRSDVSQADRDAWTAMTLGGVAARDFDLEAGSAEATDRMGRGVPLF